MRRGRLQLGPGEVLVPDELLGEYLELRARRLARLSSILSQREMEIMSSGFAQDTFNNMCRNAYDFRRLLS
jgi:hypothetical protein